MAGRLPGSGRSRCADTEARLQDQVHRPRSAMISGGLRCHPTSDNRVPSDDPSDRTGCVRQRHGHAISGLHDEVPQMGCRHPVRTCDPEPPAAQSSRRLRDGRRGKSRPARSDSQAWCLRSHVPTNRSPHSNTLRPYPRSPQRTPRRTDDRSRRYGR